MSVNDQGANAPQEAPKYVTTIFDDYRLRLFAPNPAGGEQKASFRFSFFRNNPRIYFNSGVDEGPMRGKKSIRVSIITLQTFANALRAFADGTMEPISVGILSNYGPDGRWNDTPVSSGSILIDRDKDGVIFLGVRLKEFRPIQFKLVAEDYHPLTKPNGDPLDLKLVSNIIAKAYADIISNAIPIAIHQVSQQLGVYNEAPTLGPIDTEQAAADSVNYQERMPRQNSGQGQGGYQKRNYGGNNRWSSNGGQGQGNYQKRNYNGGGNYNSNNNGGNQYVNKNSGAATTPKANNSQSSEFSITDTPAISITDDLDF